mmetsp:Transcript_46999/g.84192  ORF Transcript_46999/g.84192 Transcript_46999/m.84192 type:complete len:80 (-) Transcript_46999:204-443(-)
MRPPSRSILVGTLATNRLLCILEGSQATIPLVTKGPCHNILIINTHITNITTPTITNSITPPIHMQCHLQWPLRMRHLL